MAKKREPSAPLVEHVCMACGSAQAPFGFRGRHYCAEHKAQGEAFIAATQDGHSGAWVRPELPTDASPAALGERQGRLL